MYFLSQRDVHISQKSSMKITRKDYNLVLGCQTKFISESEMKFRPIFRKGLYASRYIPEGKILEPDDFYALRPKGEADPSENYPLLVGKISAKAYQPYEKI